MTVDQLKPNQVQCGLDFPVPVEVHAQQKPAPEPSIRSVEKTDETGRLCRLNLAVHGLESDIGHGSDLKLTHPMQDLSITVLKIPNGSDRNRQPRRHSELNLL